MNVQHHFPALREIGIELTNRCNFRCLHCLRESNGTYRTQPWQDMPLAVLDKICGEAKGLGLSHVAFTGGEVTLHPQFIEALRVVASHDLQMHFVTNAWNFTTKWKAILEAAGSHLDGVSISIDGAREETHDYIRQPGSYRRIMQAASICQFKGIQFAFGMVVTKRSLPEIEEMALLASQLGAHRLYFDAPQPTPDIMERDLMLTPQELRQIVSRVDKLMSTFQIPLFLAPGFPADEPFLQCRTLKMESLTVDYLGRLTFCCQLSGYVGAEDREADVLADLTQVSLAEGHKAFVRRWAQFQVDKIDRVASGKFGELDYFPCWYCSKYFGKVGWMSQHQDSEWGRDVAASGLGGQFVPIDELAAL